MNAPSSEGLDPREATVPSERLVEASTHLALTALANNVPIQFEPIDVDKDIRDVLAVADESSRAEIERALNRLKFLRAMLRRPENYPTFRYAIHSDATSEIDTLIYDLERRIDTSSITPHGEPAAANNLYPYRNPNLLQVYASNRDD